MQNPKYSIVIPIKQFTYFWSSAGHIDERKSTSQHDNFKRFFEISWKTHDKNLKKDDIDCIFFIISANEKQVFEPYIAKHMREVQTKIIIEEDLIPPAHNFSSHRKQMLLKLLIYKYVATDLYLVLDDDIISIKPFGYRDLFSGRKIKYAAEPSIESQPYVWECSRDLLKLKQKTNIYKLRNTISITPQILITSAVKDMMNYLLKVHKNADNLYNEMTKVSWTEYTLYWLYLRYIDKKGVKQYVNDSLTSTNLTVYDRHFADIIKKTIREKVKYFMIIQSNVYEYRIKDLKNALQ